MRINEQPVAVITPPAAIDSRLIIKDFSVRTPTRDDQAKALLLKKAELEAEQEAWTPFDMTRAPLLRNRLYRLDAHDHVFLLILHHIIVDGWSIGVFFEEVSQFYAAFTTGSQTQLPAPVLQYSDFARWQNRWTLTGAATQQFAAWKENLDGALPPFPIGARLEGLLRSRIAHEPVDMSNQLVARLGAFGRVQRATLFMTLLTGFKVLLLARGGRNDICVATAMANRSQQRTERVIGPLENTTIIRTRLDADLSFQEALGRVRDSVLAAHARQELPFDILATRLAEEDHLDPASIIQVFFVIQNAFREQFQLPDLTVQTFGNIYREGQPVLPINRTLLTVMLKETGAGITGSFCCKEELFKPEPLQNWVADYKKILDQAATSPETIIGRLPFFSECPRD
jgi:hypothetical protein